MKNKIFAVVFLTFGIIIGIFLSGIFTSISAGNMILKELKSPYNFEKTVEVLTERINKQPGWHVVQVFDQNAEVTKNDGQPIGKYNIIQYCNGAFASQMLSADNRKKIGAMLPKTFGVYQKSDGQVYISTANGMVMGKLFGGEIETIIEKVSLEVESILRFVNYKSSFF